MTKTRVFVASLIMLFALAVASAASASFTISSPATVGGQELKASAYSVKVDGTDAVFQPSSGKPVRVPVKVETLDKKYDHETMLETATGGGKSVINAITFGHSKTRLVFNK